MAWAHVQDGGTTGYRARSFMPVDWRAEMNKPLVRRLSDGFERSPIPTPEIYYDPSRDKTILPRFEILDRIVDKYRPVGGCIYPPLQMAWAHVQDGGATWSSTTTTAPAFGSNVVIGNIVIVVLTIKSITVTASLSGFGVSTWKLLNCMRDNGSLSTHVFGGVTTSASTTCTVTLSASCTGAVSTMEFSGGTLNVDGFTLFGSSSTATQLTMTYTPQSANSLVIAVLNAGTGAAMTTNTANFTNLTVQRIASSITNATGWVIQTTAATVQCSYTLTTADTCLRTMIGLQASGTTTAIYCAQSASMVSVGSPTTPCPFTPVAGNALIAVCAGWVTSGATDTMTITDTSNTWQRAGSPVSHGLSWTEIQYAMNIAGGSNAVSMAFGGTTPRGWISVMEYVGLATSNMLDVAGAGTNATSTAVATGNCVTTNANDLLIGSAVGQNNGIVSAESTNFSDIGIFTTQRNASVYGACRVVSATGTYSNTWTITVNSSWAGLMASFKQAGGLLNQNAPLKYDGLARGAEA